jgi:hypothetical protein
MCNPERNPDLRFSWRSGRLSDITQVKRDNVFRINGGGEEAPVLK